MTIALVGPVAVFELAARARRADVAARVRGLVEQPGRALPAAIRGPLRRVLDDADVALDPEAALRVWATGVVMAGVIGLAIAPSVALLAGCGAVVGGPVAVRLARRRRSQRLVGALPDVLGHVAAELRAGNTVALALATLADGSGPLAPDLRRVRSRVQLGLSLTDALGHWPQERPLVGVREVAGALAVAVTTGGRAARALDGLATSLRERLACISEARALSAQARLSAVVVGSAPFAYLVFSMLADPGSVRALFGTTIGRISLVVGLGLDALAALWMRWLLRERP